MRGLIPGSDISGQEWLLMELQKLQLPSTLWDNNKKTNLNQNGLHLSAQRLLQLSPANPTLWIYIYTYICCTQATLWREKSDLRAAGLPEPPELPLQPRGARLSMQEPDTAVSCTHRLQV